MAGGNQTTLNNSAAQVFHMSVGGGKGPGPAAHVHTRSRGEGGGTRVHFPEWEEASPAWYKTCQLSYMKRTAIFRSSAMSSLPTAAA